VERDPCRTCELLKELYQLKLNQFMLAARSAPAWPRPGHPAGDDATQVLKDEALEALSELMRHAKVCYGLVEDKVA